MANKMVPFGGGSEIASNPDLTGIIHYFRTRPPKFWVLGKPTNLLLGFCAQRSQMQSGAEIFTRDTLLQMYGRETRFLLSYEADSTHGTLWPGRQASKSRTEDHSSGISVFCDCWAFMTTTTRPGKESWHWHNGGRDGQKLLWGPELLLKQNPAAAKSRVAMNPQPNLGPGTWVAMANPVDASRG